MKTVYHNTDRPTLIKWLCIGLGSAGIICFILYVASPGDWLMLSTFYLLINFAMIYGQHKLCTYTVDDEEDTIVSSQQKKYLLRLSDITTVTYNESKKGRFRRLLIHDSGVGFMQICTSKENADKITAQILAANPAAEVKHASFI